MIWLIAEDETDIRNLLLIVMQAWGYKVLAFETGQKVWDWLDAVEGGTYTGELPELALLDIRMPGKRGNECANRMRSLAALQNLPIALMTAYSLNEAERQAFMKNDGVDAIVNKPLPPFDELKPLLESIIQKKRSST